MERISGGRLELGLGAGYVKANFAAAGVPFDRDIDRVARLEEAVTDAPGRSRRRHRLDDPQQTTGAWSVADSVPDSTMAAMAEKAAWVRTSAADVGRDPYAIELNTMVAKTIIGDHPEAAIAREAADAGLTWPSWPTRRSICAGHRRTCANGSANGENGRHLLRLTLRPRRGADRLPGRTRASFDGRAHGAVAHSRRRTVSIMATGSPPTGVTLR